MTDAPAPASHRLPSGPLRVGLRGATGLVGLMGRARYPLADAIGISAWLVSPGRRRRAAANQRRLEPSLSAAAAARRARASFREFARTGIDFLWANGMHSDEVLLVSRVKAGKWWADEARERGRGGIFALAHFGNWDMSAHVGYVNGMQMTTVMATTGPRAITDLVIWARSRNRLEVFEADRAARGLVRALRANHCVGILADLPAEGPTAVVPFCGGPVAFSTVPAWLALRTGALLLPTACWREDGQYVLEVFEPLRPGEGEDVDGLTARLAASLEGVVRAHPTQWYPFGPTFADDGP